MLAKSSVTYLDNVLGSFLRQHSLTNQHGPCQFTHNIEMDIEMAPCAIYPHLRGVLDAGGIWQRHNGSLLGLLHSRLLQVDALHAS